MTTLEKISRGWYATTRHQITREPEGWRVWDRRKKQLRPLVFPTLDQAARSVGVSR